MEAGRGCIYEALVNHEKEFGLCPEGNGSHQGIFKQENQEPLADEDTVLYYFDIPTI